MDISNDIFIHIGLHKTATTTLQRQLFPACKNLNLFTTQISEMEKFVHLVTKKDPLYFKPDDARAILTPLFLNNKVTLLSNEMVSGPPYAGVIEAGLDHRSPIIANLKSTFPNAKIIIVIRRQDSLAQSFYRQYLYSGGTARPSKFYGFDKDQLAALMSQDRFYFSPYLELLKSSFPSGLLILAFEEFVRDQKSFLTKLCGFLGIEKPNIVLRKENSTKLGPIGMEFSRLLNHILRNMINRGVLPGIPIIKNGKLIRMNLNHILHENWPLENKPKSGGELFSVAQKILEMTMDDNRQLDARFSLGLNKYGYY